MKRIKVTIIGNLSGIYPVEQLRDEGWNILDHINSDWETEWEVMEPELKPGMVVRDAANQVWQVNPSGKTLVKPGWTRVYQMEDIQRPFKVWEE